MPETESVKQMLKVVAGFRYSSYDKDHNYAGECEGVVEFEIESGSSLFAIHWEAERVAREKLVQEYGTFAKLIDFPSNRVTVSVVSEEEVVAESVGERIQRRINDAVRRAK